MIGAVVGAYDRASRTALGNAMGKWYAWAAFEEGVVGS